ncbi:MAG: ATP-binding protein [Treponema sp.]|nr:ATP-binding protein [Treponema sp.]
MNHDILKEVIFDQQEVIRKILIFPREYKFDENADYVLVGLRRAGKSTMLYKIVQDLIAKGADWNQIIYINFEDERLSEFTAKDFNDIPEVQAELSDKKGYFFLDEIQNIDGWEKFSRRLADSKKRTYITGSNAKMLSGEIETTLGGRYLTKFISPYNFREFLTANTLSFDEKSILQTAYRGKIKRAFNEYLIYGGFPESLSYQNKREYVSSIYQKILLGDIATRNNIRNVNALKIMMKKLAESVKDEISFTKLHNILKTIGITVSKDSIIDYVGYAQESYLIFAVRNYFAKFAEKESNPKYYFGDNGLLHLFLNDTDTALLENLIAVTLSQKYTGEVYYLKSEKTGLDIDFYIPQTGTAVQVAWSIRNISNNREIENLIKAASVMPAVKRFVIITYEEEDSLTINGVTVEVIPAWKWLLL